MAEAHNVAGQVNVYVLDVDSDITGKGRHNRLLVFRGTNDEGHIVTIREDLRGLPLSSDADRRKVSNGWQRMHPVGSRLEYVGSEQYTNRLGESIEHTYTIGRSVGI